MPWPKGTKSAVLMADGKDTEIHMQAESMYGVAEFVNRAGERRNVAATDASALCCTTSTCP